MTKNYKTWYNDSKVCWNICFHYLHTLVKIYMYTIGWGGTVQMQTFEENAIELSKKMIQFYIGKKSYEEIVPFLDKNFSWNGVRKDEHGDSLETLIKHYEEYNICHDTSYILEEEQYTVIDSKDDICVIEGFCSLVHYEYSQSFNCPLVITFVYKNENNHITLMRFHVSFPTIREHLLKENGLRKRISADKNKIEDVSQDYITKLYSEQTAKHLIENYIMFCPQNDRSGFFIVDIDNFKSVNDVFGRTVSDSILADMSQKLKLSFRSSDIIARFQEDSFMIFMKDLKEASVIVLKCQQICHALEDVYSYDDKSLLLTVSVGAAVLSPEISDFEMLFQKAKMALKTAKKKGKGQYFVQSDYEIIPEKTALRTKYDKINVIPVCLNLLTQILQPKIAINRVLETIGELYNLKRAYILELSNDNRYISMNYEWYSKEIDSAKMLFQKVECYSLEECFQYFKESDLIIWSKDCPPPDSFQKFISFLSEAGIQLLFYVTNKPIGIFGIEYKNSYEHPNPEDINLFHYIAQMIGVKIRTIRYEEEIERLSGADTVTGFMSLSSFCELGEKIIQKNTNQIYALCSFEITNLSQISEWYGYTVLNRVIKYFSDLLKNILPNSLLLSRDGNSIFHVMTLLESNENFMNCLDKLYKNEKVYFKKEVIPLNFSGGIYFFHDDKISDIAYAIDRADTARKTVSEKQHTFVLFDDAMERMISKEKKIVSRMNDALKQGEFKIYMQPKYRLSDEQFVGAEALVRWISPKFGFLPPDQFIPIFEKNEFIIEIDFFVLNQVCKKLESVYEEGRKMYTISVNQSRITITRTDYIKRLKETLEKYKFPKDYIELEITESVFGQDLNKIVKVVVEMKELGCMVSIDDFGSGFSSLNMVRKIPFDVLKLDREFLPDGELSERSYQVIESIIEMANRIHVQVICEGVETRSQVEFLEQIGCDHVQGYYFSKPMPMDMMDTYLIYNQSGEQQLKELTEKGFHVASELLTDLFHQKIYMESSRIRPSRIKQLLELVESQDTDMIGVKTLFNKSEIQGSILVLVKKTYASSIIEDNNMQPFFLFQLNEKAIKKLEDVGGIITASYARVLYEKTNLSITSSYTEVFKESVEDMLQYTLSEMNGLTDKLRCIENRFYIHKNYREELIAQLFLFLDKASERLILEALERKNNPDKSNS